MLGLLGLVPALFIGASVLLVPAVAALALMAWYCVETRALDLRRLEQIHR